MIKTKLLIIFVLLITVISCRKDEELQDTEASQLEKSIKAYTKDTPNEKIIFQPNAIYVKSDINSEFVSYNPTDGKLIFNDTEAVRIIKTGDVIYSLPTKDFPDGYAFEVISSTSGKGSSAGKNSSNSTVELDTESASMTKVFQEYSCNSKSIVDTNVENAIRYDFLTDQQAGSYLLNSTPFGAVSSIIPNFEMKNILDNYKTKYFANPKQFTRFRSLKIGSNETTLEYIVYDLDGKYGTTNDQVVLEMKLNYELNDTKIDLKGTKFNLEGKHKWSSKATLKYEYDINWTEQEKENFKNKFKGEVVGKKYNVLSIPLTLPSATDLLLKPSFDVFYELQLDISANIKVTSGVKDYEYTFNINNQNQKTFNLINKGNYFSDIEAESTMNVGMRFGIGITAEIPAFKLFDVNSLSKKSYAGIYADFGANARISASVINEANNQTCFNFKTNYTADAGIYLQYKIYFISDTTLKDKIPIYTSPAYTGSLADYTKCISKDWLSNSLILKDSYNNQYKTVNLNGKSWSAENWKGLYNGMHIYGSPVIDNLYKPYYGDYIDGTSVRDNTLNYMRLPQGWRVPTKEEFDQLLSGLGPNAYQVLTNELGFNAKPYGCMYYHSANGHTTASYPDLGNKAIYPSTSTSVTLQGRVSLYCLVIDQNLKKATIETYEIDFYSPSGWAWLTAIFNVRLIKE